MVTVGSTQDALSATFAALADPTRRAILQRLTWGDATVGELAKPFDISLPAITKHLHVLERAGLIHRSREAQRRPCTLDAAALRTATDWLEGYRQFWEESYDRLDAFLASQAAPVARSPNAIGARVHHARVSSPKQSTASSRLPEGVLAKPKRKPKGDNPRVSKKPRSRR